MPVMTAPDELVVKKWRRRVWHDYQRDNLFSEFMGNADTAVIHRIMELKDEGEEIVIPLHALPKVGGVTGDQILVGNEHDLKFHGFPCRIDWWRDAVVLNKKQMRRSVIDQMDEVRPALTQLAANRTRDDVIRALFNVGGQGLGSVNDVANVNGVYYPRASAAQRNAWHDANRDRVQYGALRGNHVVGDHAASLLNVDTTADRFTGAALRGLKRLAKTARPRLSPMRVEGGREYFVAFVGSTLFGDFAADPEVVQNNRDVRARGLNNPLLQDGDELLKGVIVREIPEMDDLAALPGAGAAGANVYPVFFCGRQAVGYAVGQLPKPTERNEDDYGFVKGRGVETCYGMGKFTFKDRNDPLGEAAPVKDWGVLTGFFASAGDA